MQMKHSNPNEAFAKGKDRWASTLKPSEQNTKLIGKTSQNKNHERDMAMLRKGAKKLAKSDYRK